MIEIIEPHADQFLRDVDTRHVPLVRQLTLFRREKRKDLDDLFAYWLWATHGRNPPNDAHRWRAACDAQNETDAQSARPLNASGSALHASPPRRYAQQTAKATLAGPKPTLPITRINSIKR